MIDGLKIRMTTTELADRLTERADSNDATAAGYEAELKHPRSKRDDLRVPEHMLEHESTEHRGRAATLRLLRDHLVPDETYLLSERDLQFADLVPEFSMDMVMPRPRPVATKARGIQ